MLVTTQWSSWWTWSEAKAGSVCSWRRILMTIIVKFNENLYSNLIRHTLRYLMARKDFNSLQTCTKSTVTFTSCVVSMNVTKVKCTECQNLVKKIRCRNVLYVVAIWDLIFSGLMRVTQRKIISLRLYGNSLKIRRQSLTVWLWLGLHLRQRWRLELCKGLVEKIRLC